MDLQYHLSVNTPFAFRPALTSVLISPLGTLPQSKAIGLQALRSIRHAYRAAGPGILYFDIALLQHSRQIEFNPPGELSPSHRAPLRYGPSSSTYYCGSIQEAGGAYTWYCHGQKYRSRPQTPGPSVERPVRKVAHSRTSVPNGWPLRAKLSWVSYAQVGSTPVWVSLHLLPQCFNGLIGTKRAEISRQFSFRGSLQCTTGIGPFTLDIRSLDTGGNVSSLASRLSNSFEPETRQSALS